MVKLTPTKHYLVLIGHISSHKKTLITLLSPTAHTSSQFANVTTIIIIIVNAVGEQTNGNALLNEKHATRDCAPKKRIIKWKPRRLSALHRCRCPTPQNQAPRVRFPIRETPVHGQKTAYFYFTNPFIVHSATRPPAAAGHLDHWAPSPNPPGHVSSRSRGRSLL